VDLILESWERHLKAKNRSRETIKGYLADADRFDRWLIEHKPGTGLLDAARRDIEAYLAHKADQGRAPASVAHYFRSLQQLYRWLAAEEEVDRDPMAGMSPPSIPENPTPVLDAADVAKLLKTVEGKGFDEIRDRAMFLLLLTTGIRVGGIMGLLVGDVDLKAGELTVTEKGRRSRTVGLLDNTPFGSPAEAMDRYLRARRRVGNSRHVALPQLWLGRRGAFTEWGLREALIRRTDQAGIAHINPHKFRHTFAHLAKSAGMSDEELMEIGGWKTAQMMRHYGRSAVAERARASHKRLFEDRPTQGDS
jgi:site-specific recombinase XerD